MQRLRILASVVLLVATALGNPAAAAAPEYALTLLTTPGTAVDGDMVTASGVLTKSSGGGGVHKKTVDIYRCELSGGSCVIVDTFVTATTKTVRGGTYEVSFPAAFPAACFGLIAVASIGNQSVSSTHTLLFYPNVRCAAF